MMELHTSFNTLDFIVLGIVFLSGLLAILTGFVREVYSLFNWVASVWIGTHYYRYAAPYIHKYISNHATVTYVAMFAVFCVSFIVLGLIGNVLCRFLTGGPAVTAIDRSLGFVFGLLRGAFIVCLIYFVATSVLWPDIDRPLNPAADNSITSPQAPKTEEPVKTENGKTSLTFSAPHWLMDARTRPLMQKGAAMLKEFIPEKAIEKTTSDYLDKKEDLQEKADDRMNDRHDQTVIKTLGKE